MKYFTLKECLTTPIWEWKWLEIETLSSEELESLCKIMGISFGGTRSVKISRLKSVAEVRQFLCNQSLESLQQLPKKVLVENAKKVGAVHYLNKYGIAASLINWRTACNNRGMNYAKQLVHSAKDRPKQLVLDLF